MTTDDFAQVSGTSNESGYESPSTSTHTPPLRTARDKFGCCMRVETRNGVNKFVISLGVTPTPTEAALDDLDLARIASQLKGDTVEYTLNFTISQGGKTTLLETISSSDETTTLNPANYPDGTYIGFYIIADLKASLSGAGIPISNNPADNHVAFTRHIIASLPLTSQFTAKLDPKL